MRNEMSKNMKYEIGNMLYDQSRKRRALRTAARQRGMTLIEVLVTLSIFMSIMLAVMLFEYNMIMYPRNISASLTTAQDTQVLLKTMLRELRSMQPGANGAFSLIATGTSTVSFFNDSDGDGVTEQISYAMSSSSIYRSVVEPTGIPVVYNQASALKSMIVTNVRNGSSTPLFQYFDSNYTGSSSPLTQPVTTTKVSLIKIQLVLDVDVDKMPPPVTYTVQVSLRNLKTNL